MTYRLEIFIYTLFLLIYLNSCTVNENLNTKGEKINASESLHPWPNSITHKAIDSIQKAVGLGKLETHHKITQKDVENLMVTGYINSPLKKELIQIVFQKNSFEGSKGKIYGSTPRIVVKVNLADNRVLSIDVISAH